MGEYVTVSERRELISTPTRRQLLTGLAIAFAGLAVSSECRGSSQQSPSKDAGAPPNPLRTSLHYSAELKASPKRVYEVLLDPKLFATLTGLPAEIDARPGGAFRLFSGQIEGRIVELAADERIVQAWRPAHWAPGVYSIVRFALASRGAESTMNLDHVGFPEGDADGLDSGWHEHYLEPLRKHFS